jgi:hypothetical protein
MQAYRAVVREMTDAALSRVVGPNPNTPVRQIHAAMEAVRRNGFAYEEFRGEELVTR